MHAKRFFRLPCTVVCWTWCFEHARTRAVRLLTPLLALVGCLFAHVSTAEDSVGVLITGPLLASVGEKLSFEVELVNRAGKPLSGLRIVDYFDKGFRHEASLSPIEQKGTIDLAAGTSRRITLEFIAASPGRQCHRVEILDPSHEFVGGATACVEVSAPPEATATNAPAAFPPATTSPPATADTSTVTPPPTGLVPPSVMVPPVPAATAESAPPAGSTLPGLLSPSPLVPGAIATATASLEMEITGPTERKPGELADFIATVHNTGQVASSGGTLELSWDAGFIPAEASDGYEMESNKVSWVLPSVEPGGKLRRQINLRLPTSAPAAPGFRQPRMCLRGVLSGVVGGVLVADECCVGLAADPTSRRTLTDAGLKITLADCDDPVQIGSSTTLICTIRNEGSSPSGLLSATILLPEQAKLVGDPSPSRVRIDGRTVSFDGIPSLAPGALTTLELAIRLPAGGLWKSEVILTGDELEGSATGHAETTALTP